MKKQIQEYLAALPRAARIAQAVICALALTGCLVMLLTPARFCAWLPLPVAAVLCSLVRAALLRKRIGWWPLVRGLLWAFTLSLYIRLSVNTSAWALTWLMFPIGLCVVGAAAGVFHRGRVWVLRLVLCGLLALALTALLGAGLVLRATGLG